MPVSLGPEDRNALTQAIHASIIETIRAIYDPDPLDFAEAAMATLATRGIIAAAEDRPDPGPRRLHLKTELDTIVLSIVRSDDTVDGTVRLSPAQALDLYVDLYLALPTRTINAAQNYIDALGKER